MGKRTRVENNNPSEVPFAKFAGVLSLGGRDLDVYVLSNEERVLSMRGMVRALTGANNSVVEEIPGVKSFLPLIFNDSSVETFSRFVIPRRVPIQMTICVPAQVA